MPTLRDVINRQQAAQNSYTPSYNQGGYSTLASRLGFGGQSGYLPNQLQMPSGFGGSNAANIQRLAGYQNQLSELQRQRDAENAQRNFSLSGGTDPGPMRKMNLLERGLSGFNEFASGLTEGIGWDPNKSLLDIGNDLKFVASLPFQLVQGIGEGGVQAYEAATGTPLLEGRDGMVGTNELDASQRAASLANAFINLGGVGLGGSGRFVGTIGKGLTKGTKFGNMAEGMFSRAMQSPAAKVGGQLAFDSAEEAGEEFGQAYLDAVRMKNLGDDTLGNALTGAKWGAIGGGTMSAGSLALRKGVRKINEMRNPGANEIQSEDDGAGNVEGMTGDPSRQTAVQDSPQWLQDLRNSGGSAQRMTSTQQALLDNMGGARRRLAGAGTFKMSYGDRSLRRNDTELGSDDIKSIFQNGYDSQVKIAKSFRLDPDDGGVETLRDVLFRNTYNGNRYGSSSEAINALRADKFGPGERQIVTLGRNPDTKNGAFSMVLSNVFEGSGIHVHPWIAPIIGADFDGDQASIYFDTDKTNTIGFPTDMMRSPEGSMHPVPNKPGDYYGRGAGSEASWYFAGMDKTLHTDRSAVRNAFQTVLAPYGQSMAGKIDEYTDKFVEANRDEFEQAKGNEDGDRDYEGKYSDLFSAVSRDVYDATGDQWAGRNAVEDLLDTFETSLETEVQDWFEGQVRTAKAAVKYAAEDEDGLREMLNRGTTGRYTQPAQLFEYLGAIAYSISGKGNLAFRQYAMLNFTAKDHDLRIASLRRFAEETRDPNIFESLIRASFRMEASGVSPATAIEGLVDTAVISRTIGDFGESRSIRSKADLDEFLEYYVKRFNEVIEIYNKAEKVYSSEGIVKAMDGAYKNTLSGADDPNFARSFMKVFGNMSVSELFDETFLPEDLQGMTIKQLVEPHSERTDRARTAMMRFDDPSIQSFIQRLASNMVTEKRTVYSKWMEGFRDHHIDDIAKKIKWDSEGHVEHIEPNDQATLWAYLDGVSMRIDPRIAMEAGLYGLEVFNTDVGKMLISENSDDRINAAFCISTRTQFDHLIEMLNNQEENERLRAEKRNYAIGKLDQMAKISDLHEIIVSQLLHHGSSSFLDTVSSIDKTMEQKMHAFNELKENHHLDDDVELLDLLKTEDSDFALSSVSNRIRESNDCIARSRKLLFDQDRADVRRLEDRVRRNGANQQMFTAWFEELLSTTRATVNLDLLGAEVYAASTVAKGAMEKGTNFGAAIHTATSMDLAINGGQMSFIDSAISVPNGVISMSDFTSNRNIFLSVLSDSDFSIRVADEVTGKSIDMNRAAIIKAADPDASGKELTPETILKILNKWPQLCGWLADSKPQPTTVDGMEASAQGRTNSLDDSFAQYCTDHSGVSTGSHDLMVERQVRMAKNALSVDLMNQQWYRGALVRCVGDAIDEKISSYPAIVNEMKKIHKQMVDGWFAYIIQPSGGMNAEMMIDDAISRSLMRSVDDIKTLTEVARESLSDLSGTQVMTKNVFWAVGEQIAMSDFYGRVADIASKRGLSGYDTQDPNISKAMSRSVKAGAEKTIEDHKTLIEAYKAFYAAYALAMDENPNISFTPDLSHLEYIKSKIDGDTRIEDKEDFKDEVEKAFKAEHKLFNMPVRNAPVISAGDVGNTDRVYWRSKMIEIKKAIGDPVDSKGLDEIDKELDVAFDPKKNTEEELGKLRVIWNNLYFEWMLNELSRVSGAKFNANMYKAQYEYHEDIKRYREDVKDRIEGKLGYHLNSAAFSSPEYTSPQIPTPSFANRTAEALANNLRNMDQSGWVPSTVSLNGGMTKQMAGFGFLSRDTVSPIPPRQISFQELSTIARDNPRNRVAIITGGPIDSSDIRTAKALYDELSVMPDAQRQTIQIGHFDPADNPHGCYDSNTPVSRSYGPHQYKRLPGIIARIIDFSQEAMVLKAKKNLGDGDVLVRENPDSAINIDDMTVSRRALANPQTAFRDIHRYFLDARSQFQSNLESEFTGKTMAKLGFDAEQAMILAQGLTPGMVITLSDGTQRVLDASYIMAGEQQFNAKWAEITGNGQIQAVAAKPLIVSPREASFRIMRAVSDKYHESDQHPSELEVREAADNAMNDWSDYEVGTLTVDEVMSNFQPVGYAWNSPLLAPDFRTPVQYFVDEAFGGNQGAGIDRSNDVEFYRTPMRSDDKTLLRGKELGSRFKGDVDFVVVQAILPDQSSMLSSVDKRRNMYIDFGEVASTPGEDLVRRDDSGRVKVTDNMAIACLDISKIQDAYDWSAKTGGFILVRKSDYDKFGVSDREFGRIGETAKIKYMGKISGKEDFIAISPFRDRTHALQRAGMPTGSNEELDPDEIQMALVDTRNDFHTGDANGLAMSPLHDFSRRDLAAKTVSLTSLLGRSASASRCTIATREQILGLRDEVNNGDMSRFDFDGLRSQGIEIEAREGMAKLRGFINRLASGREGDFLSKRVSSGDCIAFVTDGARFAPIFMPKTAPRNIRRCSVDINPRTNEVMVSWDGNVGFDGPNGYMKMALDGPESYKMIVKPYEGDSEPKLAFGRNGAKQSSLHLVVNADTEAGRLSGVEKNMFIKDVWYASRKFSDGLLYRKYKDEDGKIKWEVNPVLKAQGMTDKTINDLESDSFNSAWDSILSGTYNFIPDTDAHAAEKNRAIRMVLAKCKRYKISPRKVMSTMIVDKNGNARRSGFNTTFFMIFSDMSRNDIIWFFNAFDQQLIPQPNKQANGNTLMDIYGNTYVYYNGMTEPEYLPVRYGKHRGIGDEESLTTPSGEARWGTQHIYRRAMDTGYLDSEWKDAIEWSDFMTGNHEYINIRAEREEELGRRLLRNRMDEDDIGDAPSLIDEYATDTWQEIKHSRRMREIGRNRTKIRRIIDGDEVLENPQSDPRIQRAVDNFKAKFGSHWNWRMICMQVDRQNGYTYDNEAHHQVDVDTFVRCIDAMIANWNEGNPPISNRVVDGATLDNRYALAMLSKDEVDWWWRSPEIKNRWGTKSAFIEAVKANAMKSSDQLEFITSNPSQKKALITAYDYDFRQWGMHVPLGYVYGGIYTDDIVHADNILANALRQGQGTNNQLEFDGVTWDELTKRQQKVLRDLISAGKKEDRFILQRDENGKARVKVNREDGKTISAVLNSLTETTKVMALLNPGVFVSNLIDRGFHQGFQNAAIWMGTQMHIGPYTSKKPPNQEDVRSAANDQQMIEAYSTYRIAMLTGTELEFLDAVSGGLEGMRAWKEKRWSEMTPAQKISARVYDIQTGSNKLVKGQIKNFLNRFAQFAEVDPTQQHWFQQTPSGKTLFEERLASDPANLFIELMGGNRGEGTSFVTAQQAMNSAQQGDMAQRNVLAMMLGQVCRKSPLAKFFVTTTVSRFPAYSLNVTGRMLNWVLPMSSINYVFTEKMAEYGHARAERAASKSGTDEAKRGYTDPHYELAQVHRNLREAMLVDITHLGVAATAAVLVGMAGGIQPPDDEKKWGNVDEWLVCGLRVGDAWWIQDILGAALPVAAFTKSAMEGKPRIDVLMNGLRDACASNPVIKVADAVGWIMDPEGSLISDYEQDYEQYQNAKGGPPGFLDWMNANAIGFGMTWVSQFFTPSCLREWYQNAQSFERSYKRVFQTTDTGILSEAGQQGYTEWTTYADAQVRRATRRNPVLGLLADLILHPTTGYMAGEMPMTVYRDDAQLASADYWSINGLAPEEQQAKILEIIMEMQSYDDMDELAHTGFFLDQETKAALSSVVWDTVYELDNWYYGLQADGSLDYYVLGNGDFKTGQKLAAQIKLDWKNQKQAWSDFYYDKVRSDALNGGMTTYNRYNTTYAKDVYGDVYATGMRPQGLLPFTSGPGTVTNPEGTAGYQNDFMTVSAVTGQPMNQRALIPTTRFTEDWPDLEYWSGNGEGSGYSQVYNNWYGGSGSQPTSGNTSGTPAYNGGTDGTYPGSGSKLPSAAGTTTTSRRRRSGGGGSRRRSSGGGGGGSSNLPNIYARYQAPYASSPVVMGRANRIRSNLEYLRPSWETKGSRESYKREDI